MTVSTSLKATHHDLLRIEIATRAIDERICRKIKQIETLILDKEAVNFTPIIELQIVDLTEAIRELITRKEAFEEVVGIARESGETLPLATIMKLKTSTQKVYAEVTADDLMHHSLSMNQIFSHSSLRLARRALAFFEGQLPPIKELYASALGSEPPIDHSIGMLHTAVACYQAGFRFIDQLKTTRLFDESSFAGILRLHSELSKISTFLEKIRFFSISYEPFYASLNPESVVKFKRLGGILRQIPHDKFSAMFGFMNSVVNQLALYFETSSLLGTKAAFKKLNHSTRELQDVGELHLPKVVEISKSAYRYLTTHEISFTDPGKILAKGTFGEIKKISFAREPKVIKTCFLEEDETDLRRGAARIHNIGRCKYFADVDWIESNQVIMSEHSIDLSKVIHDHYDYLIQKIPLLAEVLIGGLAVLHSANLTIGDISTRNILLHHETSLDLIDGPTSTFKFCDFDSIRSLGEKTNLPGTYMFLAPEMVVGEEAETTMTKECNVWSIGVILFTILNNNWFADGDLSYEHVQATLATLTQAELDAKIDQFLTKSKTITYLGVEALEPFLIQQGILVAQSKLIDYAKEHVEAGSKKDEYLHLKSLGNEKELNSFLYSYAIELYLQTKSTSQLKRFFRFTGEAEFKKTNGKEALEALYNTEGEKELIRLISLLKRLLRINPLERPPIEAVFDEFVLPAKLAPDSTRPSETLFSILELH